MSAFLVNPTHLSICVDALIESRVIENGAPECFELSPEMLFGFLYRENVKSIDYRYPRYPDMIWWTPEGHPGLYRSGQYRSGVANLLDLHAGDLASVLRCYRYQTCEHPEYADSLISNWIDEAIIHFEAEALALRLPESDVWEITNEEAAA